MYKRILVPVDPSDSASKAIDCAIYLAKQYGASLTGLVILDKPGIDHYIGPLPIGASKYAHEMEHRFITEAQKVIDKLIDKFTERCQAAEVEFSIHKSKGMPAALIVEESRFFDLMVLGRASNFNFAINEERGHTFERVMSKCNSTIVAVPENFDKEVLENGQPDVVIALDGSLESSTALLRFAQLVSDKTSKVHLIMSHSDENFAKYILDNSAELLEAYGLENIKKYHTEENIINYVDDNFMEKADMFVIGPRTTNTIAEFFLGSFTKYLLKNTDKILFIGQ
jgi:nucleotide-binding universal stress UspA family protein